MHQIITAKNTKVIDRLEKSTLVFNGVRVLELDIHGELKVRLPGYFSNALLCRLQQGMKAFGLSLSIRRGLDHETGAEYLAIYRKKGKDLKRLGWPHPEVQKISVYQVGSAI